MAKGIDGAIVRYVQVITISLIFFSQLTISVPIYDESLALLALKASLNDPLLHLADWKVNGTSSPCSWTGVACGNSSSVSSLNLSNMNLSGVVSSELGNLKNLVNVSLDRNNFTGQLPAEIVTLSQLQYLNVSNSGFSGNLPSNFSQLHLLQVWCLIRNHFHKLVCFRLNRFSTLMQVSNNFFCEIMSLDQGPHLFRYKCETTA